MEDDGDGTEDAYDDKDGGAAEREEEADFSAAELEHEGGEIGGVDDDAQGSGVGASSSGTIRSVDGM